LYLITRADLSSAQQAVQAAHALQEFNVLYPQEALAWHGSSNTLAFLSVPSEQDLSVLHRRAIELDVPVAPFREPDRSNELTAIALGPPGKKLTKGLSLALNDHSQEYQSNHADR
jgi:hypothetical protein